MSKQLAISAAASIFAMAAFALFAPHIVHETGSGAGVPFAELQASLPGASDLPTPAGFLIR